MSNVHFKFKDSKSKESEPTTLEIEDLKNFHIHEVSVFTGNDDYENTDELGITVDKLTSMKNPKLMVGRRSIPEKVPSKFRIRNEMGVKIHLFSEDDEWEYVLTICHHKGTIALEVQRYDEVNESDLS